MTRFYLCFLFMTACLFRLSCTDIKSKELENLFIVLLLPCALFTKVGWISRLAGFLLPFLLVRFYGFGDILLLSVLGCIFGGEILLYLFAGAALLCGIFCVIKLLKKQCGAKDTVPFAPFIAISALFVMLEYRSFLFF